MPTHVGHYEIQRHNIVCLYKHCCDYGYEPGRCTQEHDSATKLLYAKARFDAAPTHLQSWIPNAVVCGPVASAFRQIRAPQSPVLLTSRPFCTRKHDLVGAFTALEAELPLIRSDLLRLSARCTGAEHFPRAHAYASSCLCVQMIVFTSTRSRVYKYRKSCLCVRLYRSRR